jgi:WD repeat-containing protein 35
MQGRNTQKTVELCYKLDDYASLEKISNSLTENDPLLKDIADKFISIGQCRQAVNALMKLGDVAGAVNACVYLNQWNLAIELAENHHVKDIEKILNNYAEHILSNGKRKEVVELYRKANLCQQAAKVLFDMAEFAAKANANPVIIKKLYVLGAREIERHHTMKKLSRNTVRL